MNVLIVDIDSLRPDHLGCYGYDRDTSSTIDALAEEGVRFDRCYVSDAPCLPSRTALAACRFGVKTGVVTHDGEGQWFAHPGTGHDPDSQRKLSFRHLAEEGVYTASISQFSQRHLAYHFSGAFQESIQPTATAGGPALEDCTDVTPIATDWIERHADDGDWLLHVNYWDVHHPYLNVADRVEDVRESGAEPDWPDQAAIDAQQGMTGVRCADLWLTPDQFRPGWEAFYEDWAMPARVGDRADLDQMIDGYDASIRRVDHHVSQLVDALERNGIREETAIVITADHGEAFGEHGIYAEHAFPHPASQHVPLIVSWPGVTGESGNEAVEAQVYQFDLMPTICDLLELPIPTGWDAEPFTRALRGEPYPGRPTIVAGQGIYTHGRALYRDDWVYIRLLHPGVFSMPGLYNDPDLPADGLELLHDRSRDPHMTMNLIDAEPDRAAELRGAMDRWLTEHVSDRWYDQRPTDARGIDPLARAGTEGPYLYVDPYGLEDLYAERGRSESQRAALRRSIDSYPFADRPLE